MKARGFDLVALLLALVGVAAIAVYQPTLGARIHHVKAREDVSALPPPKQLKVMALGYKQSTVDLLWAKLVVEWGLAHHEKRAFPDLTRYIDAILEIEPDFPTVYQFLDTLVVYGPTLGTADDARTARRYLKRGTEERTYDPEVWLHYGQFCAFLAPTFLTDKVEIEEFRMEGARAMMRAVELGSDAERALSAATILKKGGGEKQARRDGLRRAYALTDDPETRRNLLFQLSQVEEMPGGEEDVEIVERELRRRFPNVSRSMGLLIGPSRNPAACAGPASYDVKRCPRDWPSFIDAQR